jgi:hypothetical protein
MYFWLFIRKIKSEFYFNFIQPNFELTTAQKPISYEYKPKWWCQMFNEFQKIKYKK